MTMKYLTALCFSVLTMGVVLLAHKANASLAHVVQNANDGNHSSLDRHPGQPGRHPVSVLESTSWMLLGLAGLGIAKKICSKN